MEAGLKRLPEIYALLDAAPKNEMSAKTLAYKVGYAGHQSIMCLVRQGYLEVVGRLPLDTDATWKKRRGTGIAIVRRAK